MMMINRVISYGDGAGIQVIIVRMGRRRKRHGIASCDPACFPVIRIERKPVIRRIDVIRNAQAGISQLLLHEI